MDPKDLVRRGYNLVSRAYRGDEFDLPGSGYETLLRQLAPRLAPGSAVLELGCGCGVPVARELQRHFVVTGVDLSDVQIERARALVPGATFLRGDMASVAFPDGGFDAVVCLYALIHVPLAQQLDLLTRVRRWLEPGGLFLVTVGHGAWEGTEEDWQGVPGGRMFWSHADGDTYRGWLAATGFEVMWEEFFPEGSGGHDQLLCRSASGPPAE